MQWQIKPYTQLTRDELYQILQLRNHVFIVEQNCPYLDLDNHDQTAHHLLYRNPHTLAAYARILPHAPHHPQYVAISRVVVAPEYRQRGLASQIMQHCLQYIQQQRHTNGIYLQAQSYLQPFYQQHGFQTISQEYLEDGIPHIDMLKTL